MRILPTTTAIVIAASSLASAQEWKALDNIIPALIPDETTIKRLDNYTDATIKVNAAPLVVNGGPSASSVQSILGSRAAGWYTGVRTPNGNGGTIASVTDVGTTLLSSAVSQKGGYTAVKFNEIAASELTLCDALKISFDTGVPSNTTKMGQPQNFSLFYSVTGSSEVFKVGDTYSGLVSAVKERTYSWELASSSYQDLFTQGGTFYLVMNTSPLNNTYASNTLPVSNFAVAGQFRSDPPLPEPSSASLALAGLGTVMLRRRRRLQ